MLEMVENLWSLHMSDNCILCYQWYNLREAPMCHRCPWDIWHDTYLDLSATRSCSVKCFEWKWHQQRPTTNERTRYRTRESSGGEVIIDLQKNISKQPLSPSQLLTEINPFLCENACLSRDLPVSILFCLVVNRAETISRHYRQRQQ